MNEQDKKALRNIGDVVKLKSGGPAMTVKTRDSMGRTLNCQWFNGDKLEVANFPCDSLELVQISDH